MRPRLIERRCPQRVPLSRGPSKGMCCHARGPLGDLPPRLHSWWSCCVFQGARSLGISKSSETGRCGWWARVSFPGYAGFQRKGLVVSSPLRDCACDSRSLPRYHVIRRALQSSDYWTKAWISSVVILALLAEVILRSEDVCIGSDSYHASLRFSLLLESLIPAFPPLIDAIALILIV